MGSASKKTQARSLGPIKVLTQDHFKKLSKNSGPAFRFWVRCLMFDALHDRDYSLRRQVELLAEKFYCKGRLRVNQSPAGLKRYSNYLADLTELWDAAAGVNGQENERYIWRHLIDKALCDRQAAQVNRLMHLLRPEAFGPSIFRACEMLDGEALEFAHDFEVWRQCPQADPHLIAQRMRERTGQTLRGQLAKLQDKAKPPRYPQNLALAECVFVLAEAGKIQPDTAKAKNESGADLIRAAVAIWNQDDPPTAAQVHRAFLNPELVENERVQKLLIHAREMFSKPPKTPQTIANYLRDK